MHPGQVDMVNNVFASGTEDIEGAKEVISNGKSMDIGVLVINDQMMDAPLMNIVKKILESNKYI